MTSISWLSKGLFSVVWARTVRNLNCFWNFFLGDWLYSSQQICNGLDSITWRITMCFPSMGGLPVFLESEINSPALVTRDERFSWCNRQVCLLRLKYVVVVDIIQRFERQFDCLKPNGELVCFRICILKNNAWQDWVVENGLGIWCYFWVLIVACWIR